MPNSGVVLLQSAADSRIPVFCSNSNPKPLSRLSRPLANLSNKVRAHLSSEHRQLFGILGPTKSKYLPPISQPCPSERPARPTQLLDPAELSTLVSRAHVGRRVCVAGHRVGVLRYLGRIELDPGTWCGVEFDSPIGLNDGSVRGVRYFSCPSLHGVLVPANKVSPVTEEAKEFISDVSESGPHSLLAVTPHKRHSMGEEWFQEEAPVKRVGSVKSVSQASTPTPSSTHSNGALIWDWTIGSQHSSSAGSLVPSARALHDTQLSKHSSFEFDDSLGILTPDQMANLPRTPSTEDVPFLLQDLDFDKENDTQRRGSKRSSLEMQFEDSSVTKTAQNQVFENMTVTKRENSLEEKSYPNEIVMEELEDNKEVMVSSQQTNGGSELMEQEMPKDLSEDTEMSDSNPSKKTSAMSVSYEPGSETVSNSENMDFIPVNRTPSLEDLPMDKLEALAGPSSKQVLPPPTSFVTSVTSIASLDNGYQGDGEWSRPASRGADHSPLASKLKTMDPMTDSDFFTESDADMHDDTSGHTGSGTGRGDRRAQVIDGTLYGGVSGSASHPPSNSVFMSNQRRPAFTPTTEEMDSSGVYSDLERKTEEPNSDGGKSLPGSVEDTNENDKDFSPEGSTKTGSSIRSDLSQTLISPAAFTTMLMEQMNTIRNLAVTLDSKNHGDENMEEEGFHNVSSTTDVPDVLSEKTVVEVKDPSAKKREDHAVKKYKMPKRNVVSKIKTMITTSNPVIKKDVEDENQENRRPLRTQRKNGRWDAVMNKIAQGKEEEKTKPSRLKEVKSKVFAGITPAPPVTPAKGVVLQQASRQLSTRGLTGSQSTSTRSLRDVSSLKSKRSVPTLVIYTSYRVSNKLMIID